MIITEILVLIVSIAIIHTIFKIAKRVIADESFDTHLFEDFDFNFQRKIVPEQEIIFYNVMYLVSVLFTIMLRIVIPFGTFYWYSWYNLYAFVQTFLIVFHTNMTRVEKLSTCLVFVVYYALPSNHMDNLILFSIVSMDPIVSTDVQFFGDRALLKQYHKKLLRFDVVAFFLFWTYTLYSFVTMPFVVDIVTIPISFYYQLFQKRTIDLQNKKHV